MALIGYARVSSVGQSLDVQLGKLKHCDKIYQEKKSGAAGKRLQLEMCLEYVREGDTLVVTRLDRLALLFCRGFCCRDMGFSSLCLSHLTRLAEAQTR